MPVFGKRVSIRDHIEGSANIRAEDGTVKTSKDGVSTNLEAFFSRIEVEQYVRRMFGTTLDNLERRNRQRLAFDLTGWSEDGGGGPGSYFTDAPSIHFTREHVIVEQHRGYDV